MMRWQRVKAIRTVVGIATVALLAITVASAFASSVTQGITGGALAADITDLALPTVPYSISAQSSTGSMTLSVSDSTGTNAGWNVTVQATDFVWAAGGSGAVGGTNIPAADFSLTTVAAPTMTGGQTVDATGGPLVPATSPLGTLDQPRKVLQANPAFGSGSYSQILGVRLDIPARSTTGTYTSTFTVSITSGP
jgi:hypothetical protein